MGMRGPAIRAGLRYGLEAFALGFVLGTIRVTLLAPHVGTLVATAIELPVMLMATGWRARLLVGASVALQGAADRAVMGFTAFVLLLLCELTLAVALGTPPQQWLADLSCPAGALGLTGQALFALLPLLVARKTRVRAG